MKKYQIAIIWAAGAQEYPKGWFNFKQLYELAYEVGYLLAQHDCYILTGGKSGIMEGACKGVQQWWSISLGFIKWEQRHQSNQFNDIEIVTNMGDGGDAFLIPYSADGAIIIGWGVGTLKEICGFYLQGKPLVAIKWSGWWADKLADQYIDERRLVKIIGENSPTGAVKTLLSLIKS